MAVGEASESVKADGCGKLQQFLKFLPCFTRIPGNHGCAEADVGVFLSNGLNKRKFSLFGDAAVHGAENPVIAVLEREVEVVAYISSLAHGLNHFKREVQRIGVKKTDPVKRHVGEAEEKVVEHLTPVEVNAVKGYVLRYDVEFLNPFLLEEPGFAEELVEGLADVWAADSGDGAERAASAAPFGDFEK